MNSQGQAAAHKHTRGLYVEISKSAWNYTTVPKMLPLALRSMMEQNAAGYDTHRKHRCTHTQRKYDP